MDRQGAIKNIDVINAFKNGAIIEMQIPNGTWVIVENPKFDSQYEYRVKVFKPKAGEIVRISNNDSNYQTSVFIGMDKNDRYVVIHPEQYHYIYNNDYIDMSSVSIVSFKYAKPLKNK